MTNHDIQAAAETTTDAIPLFANSYDFDKLESATRSAAALKTDEKREERLAEIPEKQALAQDVIHGRNAVAVPEGHKLAEVEDAQGRVVTAPVYDPKVEAQQAEAEAPADTAPVTETPRSRRGTTAPDADTTA